MGQTTALYLNDYDTSRLGFFLRRADGRLAGLSARDRTTGLPKRVGTVPLAREAETAERRIIVLGTIKQATMAGVISSRNELKARFYRGVVEVRFEDDPDKVYYVLAEDADLRGTDPEFVNPVSEVTLTMSCRDPLIYARYPTVVGFNATKAACPLGTAISLPVLKVSGAVTNPVITYRDVRGASKRTMGFTVALLATEYLEVDCERMQIKKYTAGVAANAESTLTSGDFIQLDPQDADDVTAVWPTLEVSPAASCEAHYRKAWI